MKRNVITILKQKENILIFCLFLLFFPLKTQVQNLIILAFDFLFREGTTFKTFTANYTGTFVSCEKMEAILNTKPNMNWFQKHGIYYIQFFPSLFAFFILLFRFKKNKRFQLLDWFLTLISCFSILTAINYILNLSIYFSFYSSTQTLRILPLSILFLTIGGFIFFKIFSSKQKLQTLIIGVSGYFLSFWIWMKIIGPVILPVSL